MTSASWARTRKAARPIVARTRKPIATRGATYSHAAVRPIRSVLLSWEVFTSSSRDRVPQTNHNDRWRGARNQQEVTHEKMASDYDRSVLASYSANVAGMSSRTRFCAATSVIGRSSAKLRRSPFTAYWQGRNWIRREDAPVSSSGRWGRRRARVGRVLRTHAPTPEACAWVVLNRR